MSYRKLQIWALARELSVEIHEITLKELPKFEMFEIGSQIRRSIKSVKSTIVEGYGRRRYKQEFIRYLTYALGSCDETMDHWETLFETGSLQDKILYENVRNKIDLLGKKLNLFLKAVEEEHNSGDPESRIKYPGSKLSEDFELLQADV